MVVFAEDRLFAQDGAAPGVVRGHRGILGARAWAAVAYRVSIGSSRATPWISPSRPTNTLTLAPTW